MSYAIRAGDMFMNIETVLSKVSPASDQKVTSCDIFSNPFNIFFTLVKYLYILYHRELLNLLT